MQIVVLAKEPRPGFVKTRLCPPCTDVEAAAIAGAGLEATLATVAAVDADHHVLALEGRPGPWVPPGFTVVAQEGQTLGQRLAAVIRRRLDAAGGPVVVVGMDTPQLSPHDVELCVDTINGPADAVLGPAADGGYWLIGMTADHRDAFTGVPMSTSSTFAHQQAQLERCGFRVHTGPTLRDVDTAADAQMVAAAMPDSPFADVVHRVLGPARHVPRTPTSSKAS